MQASTLSLKRIDLSFSKEHECPGIKCDGAHYLAKMTNGKFMFGYFERQRYGLNFVCGFGISGSLQFDAPGQNGSLWEELYEVVSTPENKKIEFLADSETTSQHNEDTRNPFYRGKEDDEYFWWDDPRSQFPYE